MSANAIVIERLAKRYGPKTAVDDLSFAVPEGSLFGFLGPNGAGKSTTIRVLLGFLRPSAGRAGALGLDCWRDTREIKREVGYAPGDLRLYPWMSARDALRVFGQVRGRDLTAEGERLAERFELNPRVRARNMSRGMKQKLGLILALAPRPKLLVLDEPSTALDPLMQKALNAELRERAAAGATVFFSSHSLAEVEELCDEVAILRAGRLVERASLASLRARAHRVATLRWKESAAGDSAGLPQPPSFLRLIGRGAREWTCELDGPAIELARWCAAQEALEDFSVGEPDLDRVFFKLYHDGQYHDGAAAGSTAKEGAA